MKATIACVLSFSLVTGARAQTLTPRGDLSQLTLEQLLQVPVIAAARREQPLGDSPRSITVVTKEDIWRGNDRTTPDLLADSPGVLVQKANYAGGVPINNSIYRLGQNLAFNVRSGFDIRHEGRVIAAVQNLTAQTYRTHGSGIDQSGRGLVVGYEWML